MLERQREGIEIAKKQGKYKNVGRSKITVNDSIFSSLYNDWKAKKIKAIDFMQALKMKRNTFYRRIKEYEATRSK
jgi:DNA invertase Pin-like site-specific DNA recombinase